MKKNECLKESVWSPDERSVISRHQYIYIKKSPGINQTILKDKRN
jgi:hypothetical protein